jgi:hypothetical protein
MGERFTRRRFLSAAGAGATYLALTNAVGCDLNERGPQAKTPKGGPAPTPKVSPLPNASPAPQEDVWAFRSRPDLSPPTIEVSTQAHDTAPGYIFVAPIGTPGQRGPMILDNSGRPVWFRPVFQEVGTAFNFKVQRYRGAPVLTWWEGKGSQGEYVILDSSYREIKRVRAGNGYKGDHHEFLITPQDTALITIYNPVRWDLSAVGGPKDGMIIDGIAQEVDIETGEVLFEWHSLEHVGLDESYSKPPKNPKWPLDYFHINTIDEDHDGNLLVSGHKTFTIYKIDRKSGEIIWRLGGKKSDFEMGPGTRTRYQHDARRQSDGTITIFDNGGRHKDEMSYGLVLELDMKEMSATLVRRYAHPDGRLAAIMGNMQLLPTGNVFIGWGGYPGFSEFSRDGQLLFDARFHPKQNSYRAFRFPWNGRPSEDPVVVAERGPAQEELTLYASWNGATEVATWEVLAGSRPGQLEPLGAVPRNGFETAITVHTAESYVGVQAKDNSGRVLGTSKATRSISVRPQH